MRSFQRAQRAAKRVKRRVVEFADLFRRRRTERKSLVGWPKKSCVVVGPVNEKVVNGKKVFFAEYVPPRKGSQLNPLHDDHVIVIAIEAAGHQVSMAGLKKFEGINAYVPVVKNELTYHKTIRPSQKILVEAFEEKEKSRAIFQTGYRTFKYSLVDPKNPQARPFARGSITFALKQKPPKK